MKRIQSACLKQTILFRAKDESLPIEHARKLAQEDLDNYLAQLNRNKTVYRIEEQTALEDGSILIRILRQYNHYPAGTYLA